MKKYHWVLAILIVFIVSCEKEKTTLFTKISSNDSGVYFNNKIIETDSFNILTSEYIFNGGGVAIGDFNQDEKPDIFFTGNQVGNSLYLNLGDFKFKDVSEVAKIKAVNQWKTGVATVDINNDGLLDVYVCAAMYETDAKKANLLFVNQGPNSDGVPIFKEMAKEYGIADIGNSMNATFFDYDRDGYLDLYVLNNVDIHKLPSNYRNKITDGSALSNDRLYHNNGDNTFTDVTLEAGITIEGYGLGIAISDLNYDGWPDIYVSNDYLSNDIMYYNNGDGTFSNNIDKVIKHQSKFSMGSDISDFNNDGYLDIITLDMLGETNHRLKTTIRDTRYNDYYMNDRYGYEYQYMRNMLQLGQGGNIPYSEIGLLAGVSRTDWSWAPLFVDMDNDGLRDLLITNGFPRDITDLDFGDFNFNVSRYLSPSKILDSIPVIKIPNYAFKNQENGQFSDVGADWGLNIPSFSNGAAFADLDNDGDLDYVVNNINEEAFLFRNNLNDTETKINNFLQVKLKGSDTNTSGIGTKMVLRFNDGSIQFYEHRLQRGYMSSVQDFAHFGLGKNDTVHSLEILWPDGKFQKLTDVAANQLLETDYSSAGISNSSELDFPFVAKKTPPIFAEVSKDIGVDFMHNEKDIIDYNLQKILPHKLSQNGPCLVSGDVNGDGTEDFIVGSSSGFSPIIFFQTKEGKFDSKDLFKEDQSKQFEEEDMALFDLDNDGDLDLYLVSGSNEFDKDSQFYNDRLFLNDGKGNFNLAHDKMPKIASSGSAICTYDFDQDGYTDVFIGGRTPFGQFPMPEKNYLLKNEEGVLKDVSDDYLNSFKDFGMITDAVWVDIDQDNLKDLVVVGEFMPITVLKNNKSSFQKMDTTNLEGFIGWWESIVASDIDNDGDMDLIAGNLGTNNIYQPSKQRPVTLLAKDFDNNGTIDPVMFAYFRESFQDTTYKSFPVNFWGDLSGQSPIFRSKFKYYRDFAKSTQDSFFSKEELEGSMKLEVNHDETSYFENNGDGTFVYVEMPIEAQIAPINKMVVTDYNNDEKSDLLLIGNNYGNEVFVGRYDAFNGSLLVGDGTGKFVPINNQDSGFTVEGDAKDILSITNAKDGTPYYIVSQNRGPIKIFKKNSGE